MSINRRELIVGAYLSDKEGKTVIITSQLLSSLMDYHNKEQTLSMYDPIPINATQLSEIGFEHKGTKRMIYDLQYGQLTWVEDPVTLALGNESVYSKLYIEGRPKLGFNFYLPIPNKDYIHQIQFLISALKS